MATPLKVRCPHCGKEQLWSTDNLWRPFCSERCKQIDLGAWANEEYRVPVVEDTDEFAADGEARPH
jgi:endogenous inhibitor of DNA gyrase (YacG/DUF329 family)